MSYTDYHYNTSSGGYEQASSVYGQNTYNQPAYDSTTSSVSQYRSPDPAFTTQYDSSYSVEQYSQGHQATDYSQVNQPSYGTAATAQESYYSYAPVQAVSQAPQQTCEYDMSSAYDYSGQYQQASYSQPQSSQGHVASSSTYSYETTNATTYKTPSSGRFPSAPESQSWEQHSGGYYQAKDYGYQPESHGSKSQGGYSTGNRGYSHTSSTQNFGGYSGPAPSSGRTAWKTPGDRSRGGGGSFGAQPSGRGRASTYQGYSREYSRGGAVGMKPSTPRYKSDPVAGQGSWRGRAEIENLARKHPDRRKPEAVLHVSNGANQKSYDQRQSSSGSPWSGRGRLQPSAYSAPPPRKPEVDNGPAYQTPVPKKMTDDIRAPSRPQDRLVNEIEEKKKAEAEEKKKKQLTLEELKKQEEEKKRAEELAKAHAEEEKKKAEEAAKKQAEEEKKQAEEAHKQQVEALKKKLGDEAVKAAPPSKPPETAEEIAREEEIQRKIRESVVVLTSPLEEPPPKPRPDPLAELEMSEELRELLATLTTQYLCKLCSVRIVGPQMAGMHYNGKNHLKKLRNFVQTSGRSAGFYLGEQKDSGAEAKAAKAEDVCNESQDGEKSKAEAVEMTEVDEKKYCKICKLSFSQPGQAEMHYKGKNHAKKLKQVEGPGGNGPEVLECKICCVTVTAQEHLDAHLNGSRHKTQLRKIDALENYSETLPNRGRGGLGYRGRGGRGGGSDWKSNSGPAPRGGRGGFRGRSKNFSHVSFQGSGW